MPDKIEGEQPIDQEKVEPKADPKETKEKEPEWAVDPWNVGKMEKYLAEADLAAGSAPKKEQPKEGKPCESCPDEADLSRYAKEDGTKPIDVMKVGDKEIPIWTREDYHKVAKETPGAGSKPGDEAIRREIDERQNQLNQLAGPLQEFLKLAREGKIPDVKPKAGKDLENVDEIGDLDFMDDEVKAVFTKQQKLLDSQQKELSILKTKLNERDQVDTQHYVEKQISDMNTHFVELRKTVPFDEVKSTDGTNITQTLYAGAVSVLANLDMARQAKDPSFKARDIPALMSEAAKQMNAVELHYRKKFSGSGGGESPATITKEALKEKNADLFKEIGQDAIAAYFKENTDGRAPVVKSTQREASMSAKDDPKTYKTTREAIEAAMGDDEVGQGLSDLSERFRQGI